MKTLLTALVMALAAATARAEPPTPLLWKVSDGDNAVYLLGSFHMLTAQDYPLAARTYAALEDAERVLLEIAPEELNSPALAQQMAQAARRSDGLSLQQALPADTWAQLAEQAAKHNLPLESLQGFEPWFVSLLLGVSELQAVGLKAEYGLDRHIAERAAQAGKPVTGLETGAQQIALFDAMSPELQLQALQDTLEDASDLRSEIQTMHALWRAGNGEALFAKTGAELKAEYPELYNRINRDRNRSWIEPISGLLDDSGSDDALVVVGAMHLLGEDSVVRMLKDEGYTVEQL
jgi:uncharacterized protein YbaP (TraB family)